MSYKNEAVKFEVGDYITLRTFEEMRKDRQLNQRGPGGSIQNGEKCVPFSVVKHTEINASREKMKIVSVDRKLGYKVEKYGGRLFDWAVEPAVKCIDHEVEKMDFLS